MYNLMQLQQWLMSNHHRYDEQLIRNVQLVIDLGDAEVTQLHTEFNKDPADTTSLYYHVNKQAKAA